MNNTGNPVPSTSLRDLSDNAEVFDKFTNASVNQVVDRTGRSIYTLWFFSQMAANANAQITSTVNAAKQLVNDTRDAGIAEIDGIVADVNTTAENAKTEIAEIVESLGDDLGNKRYLTYAQMIADPQVYNGVIGIVDSDPNPDLNGWYSWSAVTASWELFLDQPVTDSRLAKTIRTEFVSEEDGLLDVADPDGYVALHIAKNEIRTRAISIDLIGAETPGYKTIETSPFLEIKDEDGFSSVFIGPLEMKAIADARDAASRLGQPVTSYAPISRAANNIVAHRGAHYADSAPENSLDSYRLAGQMGFRYVETDLARTSDGAFVICHDDSINRTFTNLDGSAISGTVTVLGTPLATLRANYVLKTPILRYRKPIPTLEEFLAVCVEYNLYPMIELKYSGFSEAELSAINDLCVRYLGNAMMYIAGGQARLASMRAINPRVTLGFVLDTFDEGAYTFLVNNKPSCLDMNYANMTAAHVLRARKDGITVAAYTLPATAYSDVSKIGCDLIAGDELAPELENQQILYSNVAAGNYAAYKTSGTIADGQVTLTAARYLTLLWDQTVTLGGAYLVVEFTGALIITAGTSSRSFTTSTTRRTYRTQIQLFGQVPNVSFRGGTGGCVIHEVSVAIAKF